MKAVAGGDQLAFAALYDRMAPAVHGTARAVLRDPDHAAEFTQEVMLEAWRTAVRYDADQGSVRTWIVTLAHRRAVDRVRAVQSSVTVTSGSWTVSTTARSTRWPRRSRRRWNGDACVSASAP